MIITKETGNLLINAFACAFIDLVKNNESTEDNVKEAEEYARNSLLRFCKACDITDVVDE